MVEAAPNATLAVIDGASHAAVFERPDEAAQVMADFLAANR
jgi:pimeloyl-ACP methyl ester carboxylesterase